MVSVGARERMRLERGSLATCSPELGEKRGCASMAATGSKGGGGGPALASRPSELGERKGHVVRHWNQELGLIGDLQDTDGGWRVPATALRKGRMGDRANRKGNRTKRNVIFST
jgi:hypothetical protein